MKHILLYLAIAWMACGCTPQPQYRSVSGKLHTYYRVTYCSAEPLDEAIGTCIGDFYHALNPFDSTSIVSAVNRNDPAEVDSLFARAFGIAQAVAEDTEGAFDITCAPLINAWGFGFEDVEGVTPAVIDSLRRLVGYDKVRLEEGRVVKDDPRMQLNFSAVGDGFLCDLLAELLERRGVAHFLVDVGGEMVAKGVNAKGRPWRVGINTPADDSTSLNHDIQQVVELSERTGLATSGDYRNYYVKDGRKYAHTIDPKTGYPASGDILSATVLAPQSAVADGYATACMVLGRARAKALLDKHPELQYFFIYADSTGGYRTEYSAGMARYLVD